MGWFYRRLIETLAVAWRGLICPCRVAFANDNERHELYDAALDVIRRERMASTGLLQRHLNIRYNRAATLIELLEANGIVGLPDSHGRRGYISP